MHPDISIGHSFRAVHSDFCRACQAILTILYRRPRYNQHITPLQRFPHQKNSSVRAALTRLPRAYDLCISHCLAVRSFNVNLSGRYSLIRFIRIIVLRNYFIITSLRAAPFQCGTCHTVCKLVKQTSDVIFKSAVIKGYGAVIQRVK